MAGRVILKPINQPKGNPKSKFNEAYKEIQKKNLSRNQYPMAHSELILNGEKTIETRTYPIPSKYLNQEMVLIETPGPKGKFKARTRAIIKFTDCFQYKTKKEFYADFNSHRVSKNSPWTWADKPKWGWRLQVIRQEGVREVQNKGIIFTSSVPI